MIINTQTVSVKECGACDKDHDHIEFHGDGDGAPYIICPTTEHRIALTDDNLPGSHGLAASVESLHKYCMHLDDKTTQLGMAIESAAEGMRFDDEIDLLVAGEEMRAGKKLH